MKESIRKSIEVLLQKIQSCEKSEDAVRWTQAVNNLSGSLHAGLKMLEKSKNA